MLHFQDWRGGVRRTAVDALARLFAGVVFMFKFAVSPGMM